MLRFLPLISCLICLLFVAASPTAVDAQQQVQKRDIQGEARLNAFPTRDKIAQACRVTGGKWNELPEYCGGLHPEVFAKLKYSRRVVCEAIANEPCQCPKGHRFTMVKVMGCVKSRFKEDQ